MTRTKRGGGFFGKLIALLLGFVLGIVSTIGGIGGLGYVLVTQVKIKDAVSTVEKYTGEINYTDYITEEYAEKTVLGLIGSIVEVSEDFADGTGSLSTFEKISPLVRNTAISLADTLAVYGVNVSVDDLMITPFAEMGTFLTDTVNGIELAKLMEGATGTEASGVLKLLCYGVEGVHYNVSIEGEIDMIGENKPTTIGTLTTDEGLNNVLGRLPLASLMETMGSVNTEDAIMSLLLYGTENVHYTMGETGVEMLPITYTLKEDGKFYDDTDTPFEVSGETWVKGTQTIKAATEGEYTYIVTKTADTAEETVYELKLKADTTNVYEAYSAGVLQKYSGLLIGDLMSGEMELLDLFASAELGELMELKPGDDELLLTLAYGEFGVDYEYKDVDGDGVDDISVINPEKTMTLGQLMNGELDLEETLQSVKLGTLLDLNGNSDPMMLALAYGELNKNYEIIDDTDGDGYPNIRMLGESKETTLGDLMGGTGELFERLALGDVMSLKEGSDSILMSLAYGTTNRYYFDTNGNVLMYPEKYTLKDGYALDDSLKKVGTVESIADGIYKLTIEETDENSVVTTTYKYLRGNDTDGYYAFETQALAEGGLEKDRILYPKTTIADLQNDASDIFGNMEIGTALGIDLLNPSDDDKFMIAVAYGYEGTHYEIKTDEETGEKYVDWIEPHKPRTINYLRSYSDTVFNEIQLRTLIGAKTDDKLFMFMLYGKENVQYKLTEVGSETVVEMLQRQYAIAQKANGSYGVYDIFGYELNGIVQSLDASTYGYNGYAVLLDETTYILITDEISEEMPTIVKNADGTQKTVQSKDETPYTANLYYVYKLQDGTLEKVKFLPRTLAEVYGDDHSVVDDMMESLTIGDLLHYTGNSSEHSLFATISTWTVKDLQNDDKLQALQLNQIMTITNDSHIVLRKFDEKNTTINNLSDDGYLTEIVNDIELGKLIDTSDSELLKSLTNTKIGNLSTTIQNLTLTQILGESNVEGNFLLKHLSDKKVSKLPSAIEDLTIVEVFENKIYDKEGNKVGIWNYIDLQDENGNGYTIQNMDAMMSSVIDNVHDATLEDLKDDGIIDIPSNSNILKADIQYALIGVTEESARYYNEEKGTYATKVGELNVTQLIDYFDKVLGRITTN